MNYFELTLVVARKEPVIGTYFLTSEAQPLYCTIQCKELYESSKLREPAVFAPKIGCD